MIRRTRIEGVTAVAVAGIPDGVEWLPATVAVFPHPSGVNRWWNEPENVASAAAFIRECMEVAERRRCWLEDGTVRGPGVAAPGERPDAAL